MGSKGNVKQDEGRKAGIATRKTWKERRGVLLPGSQRSGCMKKMEHLVGVGWRRLGRETNPTVQLPSFKKEKPPSKGRSARWH